MPSELTVSLHAALRDTERLQRSPVAAGGEGVRAFAKEPVALLLPQPRRLQHAVHSAPVTALLPG